MGPPVSQPCPLHNYSLPDLKARVQSYGYKYSYTFGVAMNGRLL